jgi:membrane protein implicated in regulation of membrane protease activity
MHPKLKPKLTLRLLVFMLLDGLGLFLFSLGLASLVIEGPVLFRDFPSSTLEAVTVLASGVVIMLYAVVHVMRELSRQPFDPSRDQNLTR